MRTRLLLATVCLCAVVCSQNIRYAEYYIDSDPGYGKGLAMSVSTPATDLTLNASADISSLTNGFHYLCVRAQDQTGKWSQNTNLLFYKVPTPVGTFHKVKYAEYYIDTDPGLGKAIALTIGTPEVDKTLSFTVATTGLSKGFHVLHLRTLNDGGKWSIESHTIFFCIPSAATNGVKLNELEYFFDTDPGMGLAKKIAIPSPSSQVISDFTLDVSGLQSGNHMVYIRAKDELNQWSMAYAEAFTMLVTSTGAISIEKMLVVYPNPSKGLVTIQTANDVIVDKLVITGLNGQLVYETQAPFTNRSVELNLSKGVYILQIDIKNQCFTQKLIIE